VPENEVRRGREGSRWYNQRPTAEEVGEWFYTVPIHDGLSHLDFVGGVVLIPAKEKSNDILVDERGEITFREREDFVWTPYIKVETRVAYFWKLLEHHPDWLGEIVPASIPGGDGLGLPPGYFKYAAAKPGANQTVSFIGCSMQVKVTERESGKAIVNPPPGSKAVATATKWDVDPNALMKAETGAIGRALGFAGMLVAPGSGVATAEDMIEALSATTGAAPEPQLPPAEADHTGTAVLSDEQLRERLAALAEQLAEKDPAKHAEFQTWARGRGLILAEAQGAVLRGAIRKIEKLADTEAVRAA
jgi:hypothetical protein